MSIASELNWTTATKFGKPTEHSGAKHGKGAFIGKKKDAKKTSNKGRRAGGKQEIKDQTTGDDADGPFPGSAPLFKKAAAMHWTTAEPRPCYPTEDPVEDHCNDGIAPPAPGGGDDMGSSPPQTMEDHEDAAMLRHQRDSGNWLEDPEQQQKWDEQEDLDLQREAEERPSPLDKSPDEPSDDFGPDPWDDIEDMQDPMENAGPVEEAPAPQAPQAPAGPGGQQMTGPHDARDPGLAPDAPHQFWAQDSPHVQDALNKYLMPQLSSPNPEIAQKAQRILMEGPHAE